MKKNLLFLFMLVCCATGLFTGCSDNDDQEKVKLPIETDLAGSYLGNLNVKVNGVSGGAVENQKITITKSNKGDNQIALSLKDFTFAGINVGNIEVDPCAVKTIAGGYSFEGKQTIKLVDPIGNAPVSVSGTVKGNKVEITITVKVGAPLNQDVEVTYNGNKLKGTESSEAKITSFTFDNNALITEQPVIDEEKGTITFKVSGATAPDALTALVPTIITSAKTTVTPASGVAQNFSEGRSVAYTVVAEDGTRKVYQAYIETTDFYSFEAWGTKEEQPFEEPVGDWATSNAGAFLIKNIYPRLYVGDELPVVKVADAKEGKVAARLTTMNTTGQAGIGGFIPAIPKVTAGSLFLGTFEVDMLNTLNSTKFGIPYYSKPTSVQFSYKYTPGEVYYRCDNPTEANNAVADAAKTDECSTTVVLYEVPYFETVDPNDSNNKAYDKRLTGANLYSESQDVQDRIVAMATFASGAQETYKDITLTLEYKKTYDATKKYRIAIIFSSSKDGDKFSGAPGSTLFIDNVKVITDK